MISKLIHSDDHEQLFRDNSGIMQSLIDYDARVKSASSEVITKEILNRFKPDKDHVAVHMIMLGDEEGFGFNKNADSFSKLACQTYFNTFVTNGHMYREHRHKSPELKIGDIKYAAYNEKQHRIETLGWYNRHKAEDICESIKSGASRAFSMSCRVDGDCCTCCDHFAKSPADYCENMKERPGQYISRIQKYASVRNPRPIFFDASDVKNNADRTALYLSYRFGDDEMQKAASTKAGLVVPGFEWAKLAGVDFTETPDYGKYQQLAQQLAAEETWVSGALKEATITGGIKHAFLRHAVPNMLSQEMSQQELDTVRVLRPVTFFGRLAKTASILPPKTFFAYTFNRPIAEVEQDENVKAACCMLPGIFRRMLTTPNGMIENDIDAFDAGDGSISIDPGMTDPVAQVMSNADGKFSCEDQNLKGRTIHIIQIKLASGSDAQRDDAANAMWKNANTEAASYALLYGAYKMAALRGIENHRPDIYDERKVFLAAAHNFFV